MGSWHQSYEEFIAPHRFETPTSQARLMEAICERRNMKSAVKRVIKNKGAPGVDGMTVRKIKRYLKRHWIKIEKAVLDGTYTPMPVRRKEIPKSWWSSFIRDSNGVRQGDPASGGPDFSQNLGSYLLRA